MNNHQHINQAAGIKPNNESLEADGAITIYSLESGRIVAEYEGLEVHEAMQENGRLREQLATESRMNDQLHEENAAIDASNRDAAILKWLIDNKHLAFGVYAMAERYVNETAEGGE